MKDEYEGVGDSGGDDTDVHNDCDDVHITLYQILKYAIYYSIGLL